MPKEQFSEESNYTADSDFDQPRRHILRNVLLVLFAVLFLALGVVIYNLSKISVNPLGFGPLAGSSEGRINILVLGIGDPGHAGQNLSDTTMVVSLDTKDHKAAIFSLPRDLRVKIPGYGYAKVNQANSIGGPELAEQTVANTLGIPIHYYMVTDFTGLRDLVNAVGGIDITVRKELYDPEYPCDSNQYLACGIDIQPGQYHMDGGLALQYARCRKGTCGNDFGRAERQQEVLQQIRERAFRWQTYIDPAKLTAISVALSRSLKTDLTVDDMIEVGALWHRIPPGNSKSIVFSDAPGHFLMGVHGSSDLVPADGNFSQIQNYVSNIFSQ